MKIQLMTIGLFIGLLGLSGCATEKNTPVRMSSDSSSVETSEREISESVSVSSEERTVIDLSHYQEIERQYAGFINNPSYQEDSINGMAFLVNQEFYNGLYSTIVDLDENGIPELLIAIRNNEERQMLLDVYTLSQNNERIRLTNQDNQLGDIGERMVLFPESGGKFWYHGSASATAGVFKLFEFNAEGTDLVLLKESERIEEIGEPENPIEINEFNWKLILSEEASNVSNTTFDLEGLALGDLSSLAGQWQNGSGTRITIKDDSIDFTVNKPATIYPTSVNEKEGLLVFSLDSARMVIVPSQKSISENYIIGKTDTSQDRLIIGQGITSPEEVYYRWSDN